MRAARLALTLVAASWIVLLVAAPTAALGVPVSALTYAFGGVICHQRPDRSFHLAAAQLPVCARCFGLYFGAAAALLIAAQKRRTPEVWRSASGLAHWRVRRLVLAAAIPTAITWGGEILGVWSPGNAVRFVAALPLGAAVAITVNYLGCARLPRTGHRPPRTAT